MNDIDLAYIDLLSLSSCIYLFAKFSKVNFAHPCQKTPAQDYLEKNV